jgi:hypothetical protein
VYSFHTSSHSQILLAIAGLFNPAVPLRVSPHKDVTLASGTFPRAGSLTLKLCYSPSIAVIYNNGARGHPLPNFSSSTVACEGDDRHALPCPRTGNKRRKEAFCGDGASAIRIVSLSFGRRALCSYFSSWSIALCGAAIAKPPGKIAEQTKQVTAKGYVLLQNTGKQQSSQSMLVTRSPGVAAEIVHEGSRERVE